jgi:hypothetical protein
MYVYLQAVSPPHLWQLSSKKERKAKKGYKA